MMEDMLQRLRSGLSKAMHVLSGNHSWISHFAAAIGLLLFSYGDASGAENECVELDDIYTTAAEELAELEKDIGAGLRPCSDLARVVLSAIKPEIYGENSAGLGYLFYEEEDIYIYSAKAAISLLQKDDPSSIKFGYLLLRASIFEAIQAGGVDHQRLELYARFLALTNVDGSFVGDTKDRDLFFRDNYRSSTKKLYSEILCFIKFDNKGISVSEIWSSQIFRKCVSQS